MQIAAASPGPIRLVAHDRDWPEMFAALRDEIDALFAPLLAEIHHIGSTAVPRLCAKPKIDIDGVLRAGADLTVAMDQAATSGFTFRGDPHGVGMGTFTQARSPYGVRLYLCSASNETHRARLLFRDYLRADAGAAREYGAPKQRLAVEAHGDWDVYTGGKAAFVERIVRPASA